MQINLALSLVASTLAAFSQSHISSSGAGLQDHAATQERTAQSNASKILKSDVPVRQIEFKKQEAVVGATALPVVIIPAQCTSDGTVFLDMLTPPDFTKRSVLSFLGQKGNVFSLSGMTDLRQAEPISTFPSDSNLDVMVRATEQSSSIEENPKSSRSADFHYYIALFKRDGGYSNSIQLPMQNFIPSRFAILPSGLFVIAGFDHANSRARLFLLNAGGDGMRPLQMPDAIGEPTAGDDPYSVQGVMASGNLLSSISMTSFRDKILVWRRDARGPLLEVSSGGVTREIPVETPPGYTLSDVVPSASQIAIRYAPNGDKDAQTHETSSMAYFLVDSVEGKLVQKLKFVGEVPGSLACENDGNFIGYETDEKGRLSLIVGK